MLTTWTNPADPLDVNGDGIIASDDAEIIASDLSAFGERALADGFTPPDAMPYLDVDGDLSITSADWDAVVDYLNETSTDLSATSLAEYSGFLNVEFDTSLIGSDPFAIGIYNSPDGTTLGTLAASHQVAGPTSGPQTESIPFNFTPDDDFLVAVLDDLEQITEADETNNWVSMAVGTSANQPPIITSEANISVSENDSAVVNVDATDLECEAEGCGLTYSVTNAADGMFFSITASSGFLTFIAPPDYEYPGDTNSDNTYEVEVMVTDSGGLTDVKTILATVTDVNESPVANDDSKTVAEDTTLILSAAELLANDQTGPPPGESVQTLTVTGVGSATNGTTTLVGTTISYVPNADFFGTDTFSYTIADNGTTNGAADFKEDTGTVFVTVMDVNDPPVANDDSYTIDEDELVIVDPLSNDAPGPANEDGQFLTIIIDEVQHGSAVIVPGGGILYLPPLNFDGTDTIKYTVQDNGMTNCVPDAKSRTATITMTITPLNDPPVIASISDRTDNEGAAVSLSVSAVDPEGNTPLTYSANGLPPGLTMNSTSGAVQGRIHYTASASGTTDYTATITATDADGAVSNPVSFVWSVNDRTIEAFTATEFDSDVEIPNSTTTSAFGNAEIAVSTGNQVRLSVEAPANTTPPLSSDILFVTGGTPPHGNFTTTPIITPLTEADTYLIAGIDENLDGVLSFTSEKSFRITVRPIDPPDSETEVDHPCSLPNGQTHIQLEFDDFPSQALINEVANTMCTAAQASWNAWLETGTVQSVGLGNAATLPAHQAIIDRIRPELDQWFGDPSTVMLTVGAITRPKRGVIVEELLDAVHGVYHQIANAFATDRIGIEYEEDCGTPTEAYQPPDAYVYASFTTDIHLCPSYFSRSSQRQMARLVHELSHEYAGTTDNIGYVMTSGDRGPGLESWAPVYQLGATTEIFPSGEKRTKNASAYEWFVYENY